MHPPFRPESFDIVFSIGVLHHTPNTLASLTRIAPLVRPGGVLAVWLYSKSVGWWELGGEMLRPVTSRLRPETLLRLVRWVVPRIHAIKRAVPVGTIPLDFVLPTSNHADAEWRVLDTFDWYSPRYHRKHTYEQVVGWFHDLGFTAIQCGRAPVSVRGIRGRPQLESP